MATDLISGYSVEITSGEIITALNASAAIPGFFPPVLRGDHFLVDGAVCCPVPVEHCRAHDLDITVAVHVPAAINPGYWPRNAGVFIMPGPTSYVGGDIVAGGNDLDPQSILTPFNTHEKEFHNEA